MNFCITWDLGVCDGHVYEIILDELNISRMDFSDIVAVVLMFAGVSL